VRERQLHQVSPIRDGLQTEIAGYRMFDLDEISVNWSWSWHRATPRSRSMSTRHVK